MAKGDHHFDLRIEFERDGRIVYSRDLRAMRINPDTATIFVWEGPDENRMFFHTHGVKSLTLERAGIGGDDDVER